VKIQDISRFLLKLNHLLGCFYSLISGGAIKNRRVATLLEDTASSQWKYVI